jgi:hypothetical protein
MPNHAIHDLITQLMLGKKSTKTDHIIDYPAGNPIWHYENQNGKKVLVFSPLGPKHRSFGHDPLSAALVGIISGEGPDVGLTHYVTDLVFDNLEKVAKERSKDNQVQSDPTLEFIQNLFFPWDQHVNQKNKKPNTTAPVDPMAFFLSLLQQTQKKK